MKLGTTCMAFHLLAVGPRRVLAAALSLAAGPFTFGTAFAFADAYEYG